MSSSLTKFKNLADIEERHVDILGRDEELPVN
jgi:hypothetical protein